MTAPRKAFTQCPCVIFNC